eukprot:6082802-Pyramimonas_sp.AAC.1
MPRVPWTRVFTQCTQHCFAVRPDRSSALCMAYGNSGPVQLQQGVTTRFEADSTTSSKPPKDLMSLAGQQRLFISHLRSVLPAKALSVGDMHAAVQLTFKLNIPNLDGMVSGRHTLLPDRPFLHATNSKHIYE